VTPTADASTPVRAGRGALQTIDNTVAFLREHAPYDEIDEALLREVLQHAQLAYYAQGRSIIGPDDGIPGFFCVVQQGLVRGVRPDAVAEAPALFESGAGETFLAAALFEERPTRTAHIAAEDSFVLQIPRTQFRELLDQSARFLHYCERRASVLVERAREQMRSQVAAELQRAATLDTRLNSLPLRPPVTCPPETTVQSAVTTMHEEKVGSIVVLDEDRRPRGIFTLHDLRRIIASGDADLRQPIQACMTPDPTAVGGSHSVFDAVSTMMEHHIGHLLLLEDRPEHGHGLIGVVSQRELFLQQRVDMVNLSRTLSRCTSADAIAEVRRQIGRVISTMLAHGASGKQLTGLITQLNDVATRRVLELAEDTFDDELPPYTWLAFGSQARGEQTLHTDQDNGLLFEADSPGEAAAMRQRLLPFARHANTLLDVAGFPTCPGNVMAGNPELCLSRQEWVHRYQGIIDTQSPEALLKASIFLDLRVIAGDEQSLQHVTDQVLPKAEHNTHFQHAMAQIALGFKPALGMIRSFATQRSDAGRTLDLKRNGLQSYVAAARTLALAEGVACANTDDRLEALAAEGKLDARDTHAWIEAFSFMQVLRMRAHQEQLEADLPLSNKIAPDALNPLDRRILKEALRQAQRLHDRLKLNYP